MRIIPVGDRAALVEVPDAEAALSLALWARAGRVDADEIVPAATTVLFDGVRPDDLRGVLASWRPEEPPPLGSLVEIPVRYDGADLADVARAWGMTTGEAVRAHTAPTYVVAFCGFAPGFAYLAGLPEELALPRLATPRASVPAGSVAMADRWCGVYPSASPGGWRLLGRTSIALWDAERADPALLAPGTRVRMVEVR